MAIKAYLRASTREQDPMRAKYRLEEFAKEHGITIAAYYIERQSGAKLDRPELKRMLEECSPGDVILVEAVDRLTRLNAENWRILRSEINKRKIKLVSLDLPLTYPHIQFSEESNSLQSRVIEAVSEMMLEVLAAVSEADHKARKRRQAEGIARAKENGSYLGRPKNKKLHQNILKLRKYGLSIRTISETLKCSATTVQKVLIMQKALSEEKQSETQEES